MKWILVLASALAACKGERKSIDPDKLVIVMADLQQRVCACTDQACVDKLDGEMTRAKAALGKPDQALAARADVIVRGFDQCKANVVGNAAAAPPPRRVLNLPPECAEYKAAVDAIATCGQLGQSTRDAIKAAYERAYADWTALPPDGMAALGNACKSMGEGLKKTVASCN